MLVSQERYEQLTKHGYDHVSDHDNYPNGELRDAAIAIAQRDPDLRRKSIPKGWDPNAWIKMCRKTAKERLIISAALMCAEIDRLTLIQETS